MCCRVCSNGCVFIDGVASNFLNFVGKISYMASSWVYKKNDVFDVVMKN